jgi:thioredoxin reductase
MPDGLKDMNITLIGGGEAGLAFIKKVREKNKDIKVTLIDKNQYYFNKKEFISSINLKNYIDLKEYSQNFNVEFIQDSVHRLNLERRKVYFKDREPLDFQILVIATGLQSKNISIKGEHREGFFYFSDIDLFKLRDLLKISTETVVYISTILGLKLSLALKAFGKEIRVLGDNWDFLGEYKARMMGFLQSKNIDVCLGVSIEEVIGEGQVKATKVLPLKVFSSQLVFIDSGFLPKLDFLETQINIKDTFFTNYENVYVLGDASRENIENELFFVHCHQEAVEQGLIFADFILEGILPPFQKKAVTEEDKQKTIEDTLRIRDYSDIKTL